MYSKIPIVGYLLLFYILVSKIQDESDLSKDEYTLAYKQLCDSNGKAVSIELAEDLIACSIDDYKLYKFMLPKVFEMFGKNAVGSEALIAAICTHSDSSVILELISYIFLENLDIFRKENFTQIVIASLNWDGYEQVYFWNLVMGQGISFDWFLPLFSKLDYEKDTQACFHILLIMRTHGEANVQTLRPLISRTSGDMFTLNALKVSMGNPIQTILEILIQDDGDREKFVTTINNFMKKSLDAKNFCGDKKSSSSTKNTIPLSTILGHLDALRKFCLSKPSGHAEKALKEFNEIFSELKETELGEEFEELFVAVEALNVPPGKKSSKKLC
uniref:Ints3-like C-terminal domain-containing protein n=1 Tax=Panagrolaimus davidi TaxID=227884 RepID=A0A914PHD3_9BILA